MLVVVDRVAVVVHKVVAVDVIHEAVPVVVHAIGGDFARVGPNIGGQVGMVVINARVDDSHHHAGAAGRQVPCFGSVDVGVVPTAGLPGVVHSP